MKTYEVEIYLDNLIGGIPNHPAMIVGWAQTALGRDAGWEQDAIDEVIRTVSKLRPALSETEKKSQNVNGFLRHPATGNLVVEGRTIGVAVRDAWVSATDAKTKGRGQKDEVPALFVPEEFIEIQVNGQPVTEAPIRERVVRSATPMGVVSAIGREEWVKGCTLAFTIHDPADLHDDLWTELLMIAEVKGLGACRSLGDGSFVVTKFEEV